MQKLSNIHISAPSQRSVFVDVLRGIAIILMIIFHFAYDLTVFDYANYNTNTDLEWRIFRALIVSCFLLAVGMSSFLAYAGGVNIRKLLLGFSKLLIVALLISLSSYFMYPKHWVYFGIIHFIALALPFSILFLGRPVLSVFIAVMMLVGYFCDWLSMQVIWQWSVVHLGIPKHTVDLVSFTPWFALVLLGTVVMHFKLVPELSLNDVTRKIAFLGRHSLLIYVIHQPLLFAGFYLVEILK